MIVHERFQHAYVGQTTLHPVAAVATVALGIATLALPRRYAVWPLVIMACFMAPAQRIVIASLDFNLIRIITMFCIVRLLVRREWVGVRWQPMDTALTAFIVLRAVIMVAGSKDPGSIFVNRLGDAVDSLGLYFALRCLIRSWDDVKSLLKGFVLVSVPVAVLFVFEHLTGRNLFGVLGGVPMTTDVRDGRLRCQGPFAHPIVAGCFWACVAPLLIARVRESRVLGAVGLCTTVVIVLMCASSTPVLAVMFAVVGLGFFLVRKWMGSLRWAALGVVVVLHFAMDTPVYHLIARAGIVGGSTGYHRFELIDNAIKHAHEWMLVGSSKGTAHWGRQMFDVTNHYIVVGLNAGLPGLAAFVWSVWVGFATVGRVWRAEARVPGGGGHVLLAWALGVALFVHCTNFIGISYFGQIVMLWYMHLAIIGSMGEVAAAARVSDALPASAADAATASDHDAALPLAPAPANAPRPGRRPAMGPVVLG